MEDGSEKDSSQQAVEKRVRGFRARIGIDPKAGVMETGVTSQAPTRKSTNYIVNSRMTDQTASYIRNKGRATTQDKRGSPVPEQFEPSSGTETTEDVA